MNDSVELDELAAKSAVACWFKFESRLIQAVQTSRQLDHPVFHDWLKYWLLFRTSLKENRARLRVFLVDVARPALLAIEKADRAAYSLVEDLSKQAFGEGLTTGLPTSLMSKFAFSCRPRIFVPYDSRVRSALREKLGHEFADHNYMRYMESFIAEKNLIIERFHACGINALCLPYQGQTLDEEMFQLRAADRRLMLIGGFSVNSMASDFCSTDFSASRSSTSGTLANFGDAIC